MGCGAALSRAAVASSVPTAAQADGQPFHVATVRQAATRVLAAKSGGTQPLRPGMPTHRRETRLCITEMAHIAVPVSAPSIQ